MAGPLRPAHHSVPCTYTLSPHAVLRGSGAHLLWREASGSRGRAERGCAKHPGAGLPASPSKVSRPGSIASRHLGL